jgi:hypothetical protein
MLIDKADLLPCGRPGLRLLLLALAVFLAALFFARNG